MIKLAKILNIWYKKGGRVNVHFQSPHCELIGIKCFVVYRENDSLW